MIYSIGINGYEIADSFAKKSTSVTFISITAMYLDTSSRVKYTIGAFGVPSTSINANESLFRNRVNSRFHTRQAVGFPNAKESFNRSESQSASSMALVSLTSSSKVNGSVAPR
ncbi:hypothetical protein TNCV_4279231 [Trichonephila clavipes]|nr:hypothetical protein TNCV_4279231 [Trichonephila clavipes]